jgi:predicted small integral membrane protein
MTTIVRVAKAQALLFVGLVALLAAFTNVQDYDSNFAYVQHVLSMDTTFRHPQVMWRAITSPSMHRVAYTTIIAWEVVGGGLCAIGAWRIGRARRQSQPDVDRAKTTGTIGLMAVFALWTFAFIVVGSEWFQMWQSATWNGRDVAIGHAILSLLVLMWFSVPESNA